MTRFLRPARAALLLPLLLLPGFLGGAAPAPLQPAKERQRDPDAPNAEVRFTDGSVFKLRLLDDVVPLKTPYGKLVIPTDKILEIDSATRLPAVTARRIDKAVARLNAEEQADREAASADLAKFGAKAYAALLEAEKSDVAEVRKRARDLLDKIREAVSEEDLEPRPADVVTTEDSKIAGRIEVDTLRAETSQFGEVRLRLSDVRSIRAISATAPKKVDALPDPGYLSAYDGQVGKVLTFEVFGAINGVIYGTDTYTIDSVLAVAAVHAGVVKNGQKGLVTVKILGQVAAFNASARNGVRSNAFGVFSGFEIVKKKKK